jgi:hypothetical protein
MIDTEYLYLYDINRFSHIILHLGMNDVQKYSVDVITCKFRNLIYSVKHNFSCKTPASFKCKASLIENTSRFGLP